MSIPPIIASLILYICFGVAIVTAVAVNRDSITRWFIGLAIGFAAGGAVCEILALSH